MLDLVVVRVDVGHQVEAPATLVRALNALVQHLQVTKVVVAHTQRVARLAGVDRGRAKVQRCFQHGKGARRGEQFRNSQSHGAIVAALPPGREIRARGAGTRPAYRYWPECGTGRAVLGSTGLTGGLGGLGVATVALGVEALGRAAALFVELVAGVVLDGAALGARPVAEPDDGLVGVPGVEALAGALRRP